MRIVRKRGFSLSERALPGGGDGDDDSDGFSYLTETDIYKARPSIQELLGKPANH